MLGARLPKVLIVDDEKDLVDLLFLTLKKKGYEVGQAVNGLGAWEQITKENYDVLILDLMMPDLDGWELCRLIRRNPKKEVRETSILMLSARALPEDRVLGLQLGADDYLTKPFSLAELMIRVTKLLEKRQALYSLSEQLGKLSCRVQAQENNLRGVIHDLKTPLIAMGASAKLLMRREPIEKNRDFLKNIYKNSLLLTRRLDGMIHSSVDADKGVNVEGEEVQIQELGKAVVARLQPIAEGKRIEIGFQYPPALPLILGNKRWMERALENLLGNALKYTPEGGKVALKIDLYLGGEAKAIEILIEDTGIGIAVEDMPKIFEPLQRGRNSSGEEGKGLGLAVVRDVVNSLGGSVRVESEPQKGSRFSILLPIHDHIKYEGGEH